jgi:hypothetical protein
MLIAGLQRIDRGGLHEDQESCGKMQALPSSLRERTASGDDVRQRMSRQQISGAVKSALRLIGIDSPMVSGISMRRGGISAAIHAQVQEPVLFLQSGHGSGLAARR